LRKRNVNKGRIPSSYVEADSADLDFSYCFYPLATDDLACGCDCRQAQHICLVMAIDSSYRGGCHFDAQQDEESRSDSSFVVLSQIVELQSDAVSRGAADQSTANQSETKIALSDYPQA
jgi:hypothetical protein